MSRKKQVYEKITALYCRISLDDGGDNESMSISNQKLMLRDFAEKHGMFQYEYYVDDAIRAAILLRLDSDTFYIYHVAAVMVDNLRRLLLGINLSDKAVMDFDFPGVGFPV